MEIHESTQRLEEYPEALFDAVAQSYGPWLTRRVTDLSRGVLESQKIAEVVEVSTRVALANLRDFLETDVDQQKSNPLQLLRESTQRANELLASASIAPAPRDEFEERAMPHDMYGIGPLTWRDLSEEVHDAGITWGAWKAATVLSRRRDEGKIV